MPGGGIAKLKMNAEDLIKHLTESESIIIGTAESCTLSHAGKIIEDRWNILQILEHVLITEKLVLSLLLTPPGTTAPTEEIVGSEKLRRIMIDMRSRKISAPSSVQPAGAITSIDSFKAEFSRLRKIFYNAIRSGRIAPGNAVYTHPVLGEMTVTDWLNYLPLHGMRHMEQIKDLTAELKK
jgi:hypothetical protein